MGFLKKLFRQYIWKRIFYERLSEPLHLNIISLFVFLFGSYRMKCDFDLVLRSQHAYSLYKAADLAVIENKSKVTVVEFGVAAGAGLSNLQNIAKKINKLTQTMSRGSFIKDTAEIKNIYGLVEGSQEELETIQKYLVPSKSKLLLWDDANEKNIKDLDLKNYDVISFATHAEVFGSFKDFNEPFLVLSPPNKSSQNDDGLLTTSEISELDLDAELVILSACNTSSKSNKYAAGFSGLINSVSTVEIFKVGK